MKHIGQLKNHDSNKILSILTFVERIQIIMSV